MTIWRMSMRAGNQGPSMWRPCFELGVAAITYPPSFSDIDLSKYPKFEPAYSWAQLKPTQHASLRRVAYEIKKGDVIYVKEGSQIAGKGIVKGTYAFDHQRRLIDPYGNPWCHQIPVDWESDFEPIDILLGAEQITVLELSGDRLQMLKAAIAAKVVTQVLDSLHAEESLLTEGGKKRRFVNYYERNPELRAAAIRCHGTRCKICEFDFEEVYGDHGAGYIEVHHLYPVSSLTEEARINPKTDMTVVCSNCHRMIHRRKDNVLSLEEVKALIRR